MIEKELCQILEQGKAVVLPTETVYGLFAKALDEEAVGLVYQLKKRPREKAMNLNVASYEDIVTYAQDVSPLVKRLYDAFLPGPLTLILKANEKVPTWINSGLDTVGFRLPSHPITHAIIKKTGPLIGPSANPSGQESGKIFNDIMASFDQAVSGLADDDAILGVDSTILDLSSTKAKILRQGSITKEELVKRVPDLIFEEDLTC